MLREGGPDLIRRWVASLLLAPRDERERIVEAVERRMTELYAPAEGETETSQRTAAKQDEEPMVHLTSDVKQRAGYVEETVRSYQRAEPSEHRESEQRAADSTTSAQSKRSAS